MKDLLTAKGWKMYYSCHCGGTLKQYWNKKSFPGYEITTRPRKNTFRILHKNHVIVGPEWGYKLEQKLIDNGIAG